MEYSTKNRKAFWEPKGTKLLCELMAVEVMAGNLEGTTLTKDAWERIMAEFKDKTGCSYHIDKFKNKWNSLRKKWILWVKLTHDESEIECDKVAGTIKAPHSWWEKKLKRMPQAVALRNNPLECPALLEIIFGGMIGDEACIPGLDVTDNDDSDDSEMDVSEMENSSREPKALWNHESTKLLCELLAAEIMAGNHDGYVPTKDAWGRIMTEFNTKRGCDFKRPKFKNKWDGLRKKWITWKKLTQDASKIECDKEAGIIKAPDSWWDKKLKQIPRAGMFRNQPLECAALLDVIFEPLIGDELRTPGSETMHLQDVANDKEDNDDFDSPGLEMGDSSREPKALWDLKSTELLCELIAAEIMEGNHDGSVPTKDAWERIMVEFNSKTGLNYTRMKFRNKWDKLRAKWILWTNLTHDRSEIECDKVAGTIKAPNSWWEKKLEQIPKAGVFRNNPLECAALLDIIFGQLIGDETRILGPATTPPQDVVDDEEESDDYDDPELEEMENTKQKAVWDSESTKLLCELVAVEVKAGHHDGRVPTKEAWGRIMAEFNAKTGHDYKKEKFKNKWDTLRTKWIVWTKLTHDESEIECDKVAGTITAPDSWWERKVKQIPRAKVFRNLPLECPALLDIIFEPLLGDKVCTPRSGAMPLQYVANDKEDSDNSDDPDFIVSEGMQKSSSQEVDLGADVLQGKRKTGSQEVDLEASPESKKLKRRTKKRVSETTGFGRVAQARECYSSSVTCKKTSASQGSELRDCVELLQETPGIAPMSDLWYFACDLFRVDKGHREIWSAIRDSRCRVDYLERYMKDRNGS